jgi:hypothetical protein
MPKLVDPPPPTDDELEKWREEFEEIGPEQLRRFVRSGGPSGSAARRVQAAVWLREQERGSKQRDSWLFWIEFVGVAAALIFGTLAIVQAWR